MIIKKCMKCGATVSVINDCNITCCDEVMKVLDANTTDGAREKHIPEYSVEDDIIHVRVNHVMEEGHYIERIFLESADSIIEIKFNPSDEPVVDLPYIKGSVLYSLCNKHDLWSVEVK